MPTTHVETTDLFRGAYYLCMGADLEHIGFRRNGKQMAVFLFAGPELHEHDLDYRNGKALVNPLQFREALNHLRDLLFERLRKEREGRYDENRARQNRYHQAQR